MGCIFSSKVIITHCLMGINSRDQNLRGIKNSPDCKRQGYPGLDRDMICNNGKVPSPKNPDIIVQHYKIKDNAKVPTPCVALQFTLKFDRLWSFYVKNEVLRLNK